MKKQLTSIYKFLFQFFNSRAAGIYMLFFALAIGIATFVENDFGTSSAQKIIFKSWWFELLLIVFSISIIVNIIKFKMVKQKKWTLIIFHVAIVIIVIGAGVTRYFGFEGIMHIRENSTANSFQSSNTYLNFEVLKNGEKFSFDEEVLFASLGNNNWHNSYLIDNDLIDFKVTNFIPNPKKNLIESAEGKPTLKIVVSGMGGREEYFISESETKWIGNILYNFNDIIAPNAINITYKNDSIQFKTDKVLTKMVMVTQQIDTIYPSKKYNELFLKSLYSDGLNRFVYADFNKSGKITIESENSKVSSTSEIALQMEISVNGKTQEALVFGGKGQVGNPEIVDFGDLKLAVSYGSKEISVPFSIKLNKFIMDKYPGTDSASSYASEVQLIDASKNYTEDFRIYMNNILDYRGYRFFQSSFDKDEKGTYLSVNHDFWGTIISYLGYILLTIGMLLTFFNKKTRFHQLIQNIKKMREQSGTFLVVLFFLTTSFLGVYAQNNSQVENAVATNHASKFSEIVVQDYRGRMKPMHTMTREVMRKLARKESVFGLNADQIILSMFANSSAWFGVDIIKLGKHEDIQKLLGVSGDYASYYDFFLENGNYKLQDEMRRIYNLKPMDRGVYDKELLKIDERVNILSLVFSGNLFKIIPNPNSADNTWLSNDTHQGHTHDTNVTATNISIKFFNSYKAALNEAIKTNNYAYVNGLINELKGYQLKNGGEIMPSETKIKAEIFLNKLNVFNRLAMLYFLLGIVFLFFLFLSVFKPNVKLKRAYTILFSLVVIGFAFHTIGLGLRWFVSGRAPWSNGYESMIYIAWTSTLAGVLFTRKSFGGLAATMILAATILMVSMLSFLDPEITPLVPVLKSYWLTIHVSLEAGSYGFLLLGAIIGLINLTLMVFANESNKDRVKRIIKELSYISELTLIGGLFMLSIGTYLGGVWANESWGRYWGWDAKETWALVSILVYAFILHMRIIPKMNGLFTYNVGTIFGMGSILMTYYGVNYYLSGLHSYATGDPIPIPNWVYIAVTSIVVLSVLAYFKKKKYSIL